MSNVSISDRGSVRFVTKLKDPFRQALSILEDFPEIRKNAEQSNKGQAVFLLVQEFKANLMLRRIREAERLISDLKENPIYTKGCAECYYTLGEMYESRKKPEIAKDYYWKSIECGSGCHYAGKSGSRLSKLLAED